MEFFIILAIVGGALFFTGRSFYNQLVGEKSSCGCGCPCEQCGSCSGPFDNRE